MPAHLDGRAIMGPWQRVKTSKAWWQLVLIATSVWIGVKHASREGFLVAHTHWLINRRFPVDKKGT